MPAGLVIKPCPLEYSYPRLCFPKLSWRRERNRNQLFGSKKLSKDL